MSEFSEDSNSDSAIQLLLFVDERSRRTQQYQEIIKCLNDHSVNISVEIKIIDVSQKPDLAEYFKLIATPTLIKISPLPQQTFAGTNLIDELNNWWPQWSSSLTVNPTSSDITPDLSTLITDDREITENRDKATIHVDHLSQVIRLSDEVFNLNQQLEELTEQLRFKDQVIGMMVHDLRNPLTAAVLALDTLAISKNPEDQRNLYLQPELTQKLLERAREQLKNINQLISDVLQLSLGSVADIQLHPKRLKLEVVIELVVQQLNTQLQSKQQVIVTDIPQDLPPVYADHERIQQVLINLLDNAMKYTPSQGKIQIAALHRTNQKVQVNIIDNGAGIPAADCELIFQKHYRLSRDRQKDGYGLGLALCRSIINAHYGQIWVESSPRGSSFNFTLPVHFGN